MVNAVEVVKKGRIVKSKIYFHNTEQEHPTTNKYKKLLGWLVFLSET